MHSKLVLVGNPGPMHVGAHLSAAAEELGYPAIMCDSAVAFQGAWTARKLNWWFRGHRPNRLRAFSGRLVEACREQRPQFMLATGIAPLKSSALAEIGRLGAIRLNYLTDDPWNRSHAAGWFMDALRQYDWIFSTRRSNLDDLRTHGCAQVKYLPFGYSPAVHYRESPRSMEETTRFSSDVAFVGGADADRVPLIASLNRAGFRVALYGGYWGRYLETRPAARGIADALTVRKVIAGASVALCLVRRANRDGSAMRTFELAAMGACMLAEYTEEHREILGEDGDAVVYFRSPDEMIDRLRWLLAHDDERSRLGLAVWTRITNGRNTYKDRLESMLAVAATGS